VDDVNQIWWCSSLHTKTFKHGAVHAKTFRYDKLSNVYTDAYTLQVIGLAITINQQSTQHLICKCYAETRLPLYSDTPQPLYRSHSFTIYSIYSDETFNLYRNKERSKGKKRPLETDNQGQTENLWNFWVDSTCRLPTVVMK